jgi:RNA polymerase sigma factor (sigma-70 family)
MATVQLKQTVRRLRDALARQQTANLSEAELWDRYVRLRDEAAFETLVRRHGPMVLSVCRRILCNHQDAEDAFQATFLVLVRRAASLRSPATIANWLHGVAYRTALEARRAAARRRAKEAAVLPRTVLPEDPWAELRPVLDQELERLPDKYRIAVILCDLEGKTRNEAADQLGCAEGTVASRLARGRSILASRLARRGFMAAAAAAALAEGAASAGIPAPLVAAAVATASISAPGKTLLSAKVLALAEGVLKSMLLTKVKSAFAAVFLIGILTLGVGGLVSTSLATGPVGETPEPQEPAQQSADDLHEQAVRLKQQLQQMQQKIDRLERETQPRRTERNTLDIPLSQLFKHRVKFEIGVTETKEGGRIEIREIWGTRPKIEIGGQYIVRGKYVLPPDQRGKLYFYATATGAWGGVSTTADLQTIELDKPEGEFTLMHSMLGPGYFHLYLCERDHYSRMFANVYFGTGDNVLRKKSW